MKQPDYLFPFRRGSGVFLSIAKPPLQPHTSWPPAGQVPAPSPSGELDPER